MSQSSVKLPGETSDQDKKNLPKVDNEQPKDSIPLKRVKAKPIKKVASEATPEKKAGVVKAKRKPSPGKHIAAKKTGPVAAATGQQLRATQDKAAVKNNAGEEDDNETVTNSHPIKRWFEDNASWLTSTIVHAIILTILGIWVLEIKEKPPEAVLKVNHQDLIAPDEDPTPDQAEIDTSDLNDKQPNPELENMPIEAIMSEMEQVDLVAEGAISTQTDPLELDAGPPLGLIKNIGSGKGKKGAGSGLGGRGNRNSGEGGKGQNKQSENAVDRGLKWLAIHQNSDGSWDLDHRHGKCQGRCPNPGKGAGAKRAATALALLPFMGAGYTHFGDKKYQKTVASGLRWLLANQIQTPHGSSFFEKRPSVGTMYSHAIVTLALCEAYAMAQMELAKPESRGSQSAVAGGKGNLSLKDIRARKQLARKMLSELGMTAQKALDFMAYSQGVDGGWQYTIKGQSDISVTGWQIMAMKSGYMAGLRVNPRMISEASRFLDLVTLEEGAKYGYMKADEKRQLRANPTMTSVGLLCRMMLGWKRDNPALEEGAEFLSSRGVHKSSLYYDYYATQVIFHYTNGDLKKPLWSKWNKSMRDYLVKNQSKKGHSAGSWYFDSGHASTAGGRFYNTCISIMILEVYYRYMPIYQNKSVDDDINNAKDVDAALDQ